MIFECDAGTVEDYPIFTMTYVNDKSMPKDLISHPLKVRSKDGHTSYVFMIGGMIYIYYVNSKTHNLPNYVLSETLKPNNEMNIIHIPEGKGLEILHAYFGLSK